MDRQHIESISTADKSIVVNKVSFTYQLKFVVSGGAFLNYELVFRKDNRDYATIYLHKTQQRLVHRLIEQFLKTGEVPNNVGWMV